MLPQSSRASRRNFVRASALAVGGALAAPRAASASPTTGAVHEVQRIDARSARPYLAVEAAFLAQVGPANVPQLAKQAGDGTLPAAIRELLAAEPGSSGFVLFFAAPVGLLGAVKGAPRRATQLLIGNPVVAQKMSALDVRIVQYFPFRVLISEQNGVASISYDLPSSQVAWLQNAEITRIARVVDTRLEGIVSAAIG